MAISIANPLIDPDWDTKVATFPDATPFHTAAWARVLQETYGFEPCYFVASDSAGVQAIQPMMEVESWATRRRGVSLPFTDECGLLARDPAGQTVIRAAVLEHARNRKWHYVEYRNDPTAHFEANRLPRFVRHELDLRPEVATLLNGLESSNRRSIRKAEKDGVTVSIRHDSEATRQFYHLQELTRRRHGIPPQPWTFFAAIQRHMLGVERGFVALAALDGCIVAGALFLVFGRQAVFKFGASDERFRKARPNNAVMWQSILRARQQGAEVLLFGRNAIRQEGLRAFKRAWGAVESPLEYGVFEPTTGRRLSQSPSGPLYEQMAPVTRILPQRVARWLGTKLYRHIA